jgi:hypothetical protein
MTRRSKRRVGFVTIENYAAVFGYGTTVGGVMKTAQTVRPYAVIRNTGLAMRDEWEDLDSTIFIGILGVLTGQISFGSSAEELECWLNPFT